MAADPLKQSGNQRKIDLIAAGVFVSVILLYLGLVPLGQWQSDEYDYFGKLGHGIGSAVLTRLWWSPRPFSEFLYGAYGLLANHFCRPLIGFFLVCLWLAFLVCAIATAIPRRLGRPRLLVPDLLIGLALAAAFLTSGPLFQVFYWPAGAVAYLPTLSVTLLLFTQVSSGAVFRSRGRGLCCLCLTLAALSTEAGAILAVCFGLVQMTNAVFVGHSDASDHRNATLWWLVPATVGMAVLWWAARHRVPVPGSGLSIGFGQGGEPLLRAIAASRELLLELLGFSPTATQHLSAIPTLLSRLCIAVGLAMLGSRSNIEPHAEAPRARRQLILLAAVFVAASFCILFATYPQFAFAGSERYETLRRCWLVMGFSAITVSAFQSERGRKLLAELGQSHLGPILLIIGVLLPWHVSPLLREYPVYSAVLRATRHNFHSGYQRDIHQMRFLVPPNRGVISPQTLAPGIYTPTFPATENNYAGNILNYFGKEVLVVESRDAPHKQ